MHADAVQVAAAEQAFPQAPQLFVSVTMFTHAFGFVHAVRPPVQEKVHVVPLHVGVPFGGAVHGVVQAEPHVSIALLSAQTAPQR
jgi:hypothetical protein